MNDPMSDYTMFEMVEAAEPAVKHCHNCAPLARMLRQCLGILRDLNEIPPMCEECGSENMTDDPDEGRCVECIQSDAEALCDLVNDR